MITPRHQASPVALDLIKRFEGYRHEAARLPDGRWTIGHGHTRTAREGAVVSEDDAEALLIYDLRQIAAAIDEAVLTPLTQNQFDALASFVFNIGVDNFLHSAVLRRINEGELIKAAFALEIWRKADFEGERIVVDALVRRRAAEKALFLTPQGGWIPAPSPLIEPKADYGLAVAAPEGPVADAPARPDEASVGPGAAQDDDRSPVERAAANLTARLRAIAPDEPPAAPVAPLAERVSEPAPFPKVVAPEAAAEPAETPPVPPEASSSVDSDVEVLRRTIFGVVEPRSRPKPAQGGYAPLALLGAAGLAVFIAAVVWAFHAKPTGGAFAPLNIGVVVVGFMGILAVASAIYFLLEKLAGRDQ